MTLDAFMQLLAEPWVLNAIFSFGILITLFVLLYVESSLSKQMRGISMRLSDVEEAASRPRRRTIKKKDDPILKPLEVEES